MTGGMRSLGEEGQVPPGAEANYIRAFGPYVSIVDGTGNMDVGRLSGTGSLGFDAVEDPAFFAGRVDRVIL